MAPSVDRLGFDVKPCSDLSSTHGERLKERDSLWLSHK
jgi:hypothetical protein